MPYVSKVHDAITRFEVAVAVVLRASETSVVPRLCTAAAGGMKGALTYRYRRFVRVRVMWALVFLRV